jgi:hypothetical protein
MKYEFLWEALRVFILIAVVFVITVGVFNPDAFGQEQQGPRCVPYSQGVQELANQYNENSRALGVVYDGEALIELFTTSKGETWTMVIIRRDGMACPLLSGTNMAFGTQEVRQ